MNKPNLYQIKANITLDLSLDDCGIRAHSREEAIQKARKALENAKLSWWHVEGGENAFEVGNSSAIELHHLAHFGRLYDIDAERVEKGEDTNFGICLLHLDDPEDLEQSTSCSWEIMND